jgi:hypothetical protein
VILLWYFPTAFKIIDRRFNLGIFGAGALQANKADIEMNTH